MTTTEPRPVTEIGQAAADSAEARYWRAMTEIKFRLAATDSLYKHALGLKQQEQPSDWLFTWEHIALHLRKITELIVFGSMVAHQDAYSEVYPDYADHWRIGKILKKLEAMHPDFFPVATKLTTVSPGQHHAPMIDKPKLKRDDLEWLYDKCADLIHAFQPFKHDDAATIDLKYTPHEWTGLIWSLLEEHFIVLLGAKKVLLVQMAAPPHGRVKVMAGEPADGPPVAPVA